MSMNVGLTYDLKTDYEFKRDDPPDANAEFDHPDTINVIASAIESGGYRVKKIGNVARVLENLDSLDVDIVFNISEGTTGRNRETQVPILLEMAGVPFVGADALSLGLSLDKVMAKKVFFADEIPTPRFFEVKEAQSAIDLNGMKFPLFVKPRCEGSSKGLTESSRVENADELVRQVQSVIETYKQPALVEEFIRGEEFTVALMGNEEPEVLPIVQIQINGSAKLDDKFYTYGHVKSDELQYICPTLDAGLARKLSVLAIKTYRAIECRDFGRVDFRVDARGNPYVLEINPLPSLSTEDVFMVVARAMGISYDQLICRILGHAIKRYGLQ